MLETRMSVIKHKILVVSGKGGLCLVAKIQFYSFTISGVGKSSVAWQLALILNKRGKKVFFDSFPILFSL
jgi:Mrp family chromosome partitioning ATPase